MANGSIIQTIVTDVEQVVIGIIEKILSGGTTTEQLKESLDEFKASRHHGR